MGVISIEQWKKHKEMERAQRAADLTDCCIRIVLEEFKKAYTGQYKVLLESRAGMFKRLEFYGFPPERYFLPIPTITRVYENSSAEIPPTNTRMEFRLVNIKEDILYYKEMY